MDLKSVIRTIPDWPKKGIMFRDITTLIKDAKAFSHVIEEFYNKYKNEKIDLVAGIESRGFIFGGALANRLCLGFVPIRKSGKLPSRTMKESYELEYAKAEIEIHADAIKKGMNVLIVDDLIATGGTALAAAKLVEKLGGNVVEFAFIIGLPDLKGMAKLSEKYKLTTLVDFEGG